MFRLFALQIAFFCDIVASYCNAAVIYCNAAVSYCNVVRLCHFEAPMARALCYHNRKKIEKIMVAKNKNRKSAARGTKAESSVRLGSEFITREDFNERFPICKMAQEAINALKLGGDKSSAFHLTNCFRGFSVEMQEEMANYLIAEMHYRITGKDQPEMTGLFHVDRLLIEILYILDHDTKNLDYNE